MRVHATAVARRELESWRGVLLTGAPGSGKSDLALRLIDRGWRLVADDQTFLWRSGPALYAALPPAMGRSISGLIELRGFGISTTPRPPLALARIALICDCLQTAPERLPDPDRRPLLGLSLPRMAVDIRPASAVLLVEAALREATRL
ncbi:HPr kinase/phosphorylase [Brevundimonas sp. VNH65]|uniref:HPr kinase/phosphorylase n=1 Tax=Brevundimonas sp. VNH65 TaxID=3400917 RepID=UPI003C116797